MLLQAEFDAEQEYIKTLSYLSPEEQQKHRDRQGVSFMYQKPPGYDAAMSRGTEQVHILRPIKDPRTHVFALDAPRYQEQEIIPVLPDWLPCLNYG